MPSDGRDRRLGDQDAEADGQPAKAMLEHARQGAQQIVSVEDEPYAASRDDQLCAVGQRRL